MPAVRGGVGLAVVAVIAAAGCARVAGDAPFEVLSDFETVLLDAGVPAAVAVPGEPAAASRQQTLDPEGRSAVRIDLVVEVPASWTEVSNRGVLCRWTQATGLHACADLSAVGRGPQAMELAGNALPGEAVEVWLADGGGLVQRRLFVGESPPQDAVLRLRLAEGFGEIADVLTRQPPSEQGYLVAA